MEAVGVEVLVLPINGFLWVTLTGEMFAQSEK